MKGCLVLDSAIRAVVPEPRRTEAVVRLDIRGDWREPEGFMVGDGLSASVAMAVRMSKKVMPADDACSSQLPLWARGRARAGRSQCHFCGRRLYTGY
jgi:hypothetical protein